MVKKLKNMFTKKYFRPPSMADSDDWNRPSKAFNSWILVDLGFNVK